jgi:5,10-methylene-tetrahydrofolate dehydrogenase/methenyl tetrahydrofolate cyclohydrolase
MQSQVTFVYTSEISYATDRATLIHAMSSIIKNIIVIGASGSAGQPIVTALLVAGFNVSVLTQNILNGNLPSRCHRSSRRLH